MSSIHLIREPVVTAYGVGVRLDPAAPYEPADAEVLEQDTCFVLAGVGPPREEPDSYEHLVDAMLAQQGVRPGTIRVRPGRPLRIEAVVHDLDAEPSWRAEWVEEALTAALRHAAEAGCTSLRLPLLGRMHGRLAIETFAAVLVRALGQAAPAGLGTVWVSPPPRELTDVARALHSHFDSP